MGAIKIEGTSLSYVLPEPVVKLAKQDAETRGLKDGDAVRITSPANKEGIVMKLVITNSVRSGMIDILHGWAEANANELIPREFDPISGFSAYKEGPLRGQERGVIGK
jgi:anaerobic selenocysteine-containing dehydrogenase